jgi:hypothetical protein
VRYAAIPQRRRGSKCLAMTQGTSLARFDVVGLPTQRSPEQTSPRAFLESRRGIVGPAEHRTPIDAMSSSSTDAFTKPPRILVHVLLTKNPHVYHYH